MMRIALFADTHGNLPATQTALAAIAQARPDQIVCLGDVAMFGPQPREVLGVVAALGCPVVMGNTDAWALDPVPSPDADENTAFYETVEAWGAAQLTTTELAQIQAFRPTISVDLGDGHSLLCYHGSPRSFHEGIAATTSDAALDAIFADAPALICAGGHTHVQMLRRHRHRLIVNPGSVGQPYVLRDDGSAYNPPWAEFALIDYRAPADVQITLHRVPLDVQPILDAAFASGMPMADRWTADWSNA